MRAFELATKKFTLSRKRSRLTSTANAELVCAEQMCASGSACVYLEEMLALRLVERQSLLELRTAASIILDCSFLCDLSN